MGQPQTLQNIPAMLIKETLDGRPLYYRGVREVLAGHKKPEEIMGPSGLQSAEEYVFRKTGNSSISAPGD